MTGQSSAAEAGVLHFGDGVVSAAATADHCHRHRTASPEEEVT
jgi:hypothetical protein